ncbi:hypothetical protein VMUT_1143 [Vulcanisaeta moutnovskia 768-28]|uniref:Pyrrolo-quinoline quinone repeat domain-containing protein n=1 Tax=Vulcanisaeta moutnovskia (strain 768-28) TaxID=985053 RepID=F0QYB1_VULM7|nr:WD40 repeat domain-containing protein [Vulcanisaeta moutnovskia]ADY01348.1 hypothetical protein VMUT_1143 [Vulcanisaeta moutnovskia 768-28]
MLPGGFTLAQSVFSLNIGSVTALSMYPTPINGRYLIAAGVNSGGQYYAYLLSWSPGGGLRTLWSVSEPENVESITVSPNYVVVGLGSSSGQGIINVYSTSGKELWSYTFTYGWTIVVNDVAISPNQQLIAATTGGPSGQPYGDLTVFNAITGNPIWSYTYGTSQFLGTREATFSPNGNYLLMIAGNGYASGGYVILFNAYNGQVIWDINNLADPWVASFSPDGQYIVVGAANSYAWGGHNHAYLISISGNVLWSYTTGPNAPNAWFDWVSTNYGATKTYVAGNGYLYLLNSAGSVIWQYPLGFGNSPIAESEDGSIVAVAELGDNELLVFNSTGSPMTYTVPSQINNMAMSSDGSLVVLGTQSGVTAVTYLSITPAAPTYYNVIFTETGLPGGLQWSVTLNGTTETTTSNQLVFN